MDERRGLPCRGGTGSPACWRCANAPRNWAAGARSPPRARLGRGCTRSCPGSARRDPGADRRRPSRSTATGCACCWPPPARSTWSAPPPTRGEAVAKALDLRPDVVVMDLQMPVMDGVTATQRIVAELPQIGVLVLDHARRRRAGLLGDARRGPRLPGQGRRPDRDPARVKAVAGGEVIFGPALASRVTRFFARLPSEPFPQLTGREREVLELIAAEPVEPARSPSASSWPRRRSATTDVERVRQTPGRRPRPGDRAGPRGRSWAVRCRCPARA